MAEHAHSISSAEIEANAIFKTEVKLRLNNIDASIIALTKALEGVAKEQAEFNRKLGEGSDKFTILENEDANQIRRITAVEEVLKASAATKHSIAMMLVDKLIGTVLPWAAIATIFFGKHP